VGNIAWVLLDSGGAQVGSGTTDDAGNVGVQVSSSDPHTLRFLEDDSGDQAPADSSTEQYDA